VGGGGEEGIERIVPSTLKDQLKTISGGEKGLRFFRSSGRLLWERPDARRGQKGVMPPSKDSERSNQDFAPSRCGQPVDRKFLGDI